MVNETKDQPRDITHASGTKHVSLQRATTPRSGIFQIRIDDWWIVSPKRTIMFCGSNGWSPQCNSKKDIAEYIRDKHFPGSTVEQIPVVYIPWD